MELQCSRILFISNIFLYFTLSHADYLECFIAAAWKQTDVFHFTVSSNLLSFVSFYHDISICVLFVFSCSLHSCLHFFRNLKICLNFLCLTLRKFELRISLFTVIHFSALFSDGGLHTLPSFAPNLIICVYTSYGMHAIVIQYENL